MKYANEASLAPNTPSKAVDIYQLVLSNLPYNRHQRIIQIKQKMRTFKSTPGVANTSVTRSEFYKLMPLKSTKC